MKLDRKAIVDELGQLDQDMAPLKVKKKRAEELRAIVRNWHAKDAPDKTATHEGHKFIVTVGAAENETGIVSMQKIYDQVGITKFLAACSMTLAKLKDLVTPADFKTLTLQARTGARPVNSFPRSK